MPTVRSSPRSKKTSPPVAPLSPQDLRRILARLNPVAPLTESLEAALRNGKSSRAWYFTQQEHLLGWLYEYDGPGA